ncbi:hypothetical protein ACIRP2_35500 [Streptomyces sp. NPDC101194]|uniref:hypothetical protein n=1 Tax=Streptomyces sp. NPDC101194 TaxID=3366127 RepID=UPI0037FB6E63
MSGGGEAGPAGCFAADLVGVGRAEHLDAAERVIEVVRAEVPVIDGEGLLEAGVVGLVGDGHQRQVVVAHVVAADDVGAVGQAVRVTVVGGAQQQGGGVRRAAGDGHDVAAEGGGGAVGEFGDDVGDVASVGADQQDFAV